MASSPSGGPDEAVVAVNDQTTAKTRIAELQPLRFLAAIHIVVFHFFNDTGSESWNRFASWGGAQLTFFFMLSGFVLSYQYCDRPPKNTGLFFFRRWARLYPTYLLSIGLNAIVVHPVDWWALIVSVFSLQVWVDSQYWNVYNTPGWAVGAFLFQYLIFPALIRPIARASQRCRVKVLLPACIAFTCLEAAMATGLQFFVYTWIIDIAVKPRTGCFAAGTVLGSCFVHSQKERAGRPCASSWMKVMSYVGSTLSTTVLVILFCLAERNSFGAFLFAWSDRGMLIPLYGALLWFTALQSDVVLGPLLKCRPFVSFSEQSSYGIYVFQATAYTYVNKYIYPIMKNQSIGAQASTLLSILAFFAVLVHWVFEKPMIKLLNIVKDHLIEYKATKRREQEAKKAAEVATTAFQVESDPDKDQVMKKRKEGIRVIGYYTLMIVCIGGFIALAIWRPNASQGSAASVENDQAANAYVNTTKLFAFLAIPALFCNLIGQVFWPPVKRVKVPELDEQVADEALKARLYFRIVTRGKNPNLVLTNADEAVRVLRNTALPEWQWRVEVATDNPLDIDERGDIPVVELLTPEDYVCPNGGKYKARALEYAVKKSRARREDWVIHMDEETRFDEETVKYIYAHCSKEEAAVRKGDKTYGNIGQGVILYGTKLYLDNYLTTLADSIRPADDFGKFRAQYELGEPLIGMHGSFVVCQTAVEAHVSFDHGLAGSITEDAYFALIARAKGVRFSWVDAYMYEQSPFSVMDFIRQRARWFGGLWLVIMARPIPFLQRLTLGFMMSSWLVSPVVLISMTLAMLVNSSKSNEVLFVTCFVGAICCWGYILGFVFTFTPKDGKVRYLLLLYAQLLLQPIFAVMEILGVIHAILFPPIGGFYIVQKEGGNQVPAEESDGEDDSVELKSTLGAGRNSFHVMVQPKEVENAPSSIERNEIECKIPSDVSTIYPNDDEEAPRMGEELDDINDSGRPLSTAADAVERQWKHRLIPVPFETVQN